MSAFSISGLDFPEQEEFVLFQNVRRFFDEHAPWDATRRWRERGFVDRKLWQDAGSAALLCLQAPAKYGGVGGDFRHHYILLRELVLKQVDGFGVVVNNVILNPTFLTTLLKNKKERSIPRVTKGELRSNRDD